MGHPNWKRLAELGQLPEEMRDKVSGDILDAQNHATKSMEEKVEEVSQVTINETHTIEDLMSDSLSKEDEAMLLSKAEMVRMLTEAGLSIAGTRKELAERVASIPKKEEVKDEVKEIEVQGEFIDELLK
jgi:hypothetical protein